MKEIVYASLAILLLIGARNLQAQSGTCGSSQQTMNVPCTGVGQAGGSCPISIPGGGYPADILYGMTYVSCCGVQIGSYYPIGGCWVTKNMQQRDLQRVIEYARDHEVLTASCDGEFYPLISALQPQAGEISPQDLHTHRRLVDPEVR